MRQFEHQAAADAPWEPYDEAINAHINGAIAQQGPDGKVMLPGKFLCEWLALLPVAAWRNLVVAG
jgi:hypothetical protein